MWSRLKHLSCFKQSPLAFWVLGSRMRNFRLEPPLQVSQSRLWCWACGIWGTARCRWRLAGRGKSRLCPKAVRWRRGRLVDDQDETAFFRGGVRDWFEWTYSSAHAKVEIVSCQRLFSSWVECEVDLFKDVENAAFEALNDIILVAKNEESLRSSLDLQINASCRSCGTKSIHFPLIQNLINSQKT